MLNLALALLLTQTPAVRRSTPAADDPGMVVRQVGTVNVNCTSGCSGGGGGLSFDGGNIGYMRMPDGGPLEVYTTNAGSSGWVPDGGYVGNVSVVGVDGGGVALDSMQMTDWVPNPASRESGNPGQLRFDVNNNLHTRAQILTDEGSFSYGFPGTSLATVLTGTVSVTNGDPMVTGAGTSFTTELSTALYFAVAAHGETALRRISRVISDTELELEEGYPGATVGGAAAISTVFRSTTPAGASVTVSGGEAAGTNATTAGALDAFWRDVDYATLQATVRLRTSARNSTQTTLLGYVDTISITPAQQAAFVFTGTDASLVTCRTSNIGGDEVDTVVTIPGGSSTASDHSYEILLATDRVSFSIDGVLMATHQYHLPDPYQTMKLALIGYNDALTVAPATTTVSWVQLMSIDRVDVVVSNPIGARLQAQVEGANRTGAPVTTNPLIVGGSDGSAARVMKVTTAGEVNIAGSETNNATVAASTFVPTVPAVATAATPAYNEGRMVALSTDLDGVLRVGASALPLPTGASTSALQTTGNTSLSNIDTDLDVALSTRVAESTFTGRFPAAAALADATANPTLTSTASYLMGYNGTTWDRLRKSASGLLVDVQSIAAGTNYIGKTRVTDGTLDVSLLNSAPGSDTGQVAVPVRIISSLAGGAGGTSSSYGSAFPASGTAAGFSDGTNMQAARVFDLDSGGGTQYGLGVNLRIAGSGGSTEAAAGAGVTSASTLRVVLPTDQTSIPVTDNGGSLTVDGTVSANLNAGTNYVGKVRQTDGTLDLSLLNAAPGSDTGQVSIPVRVISSLAGGAGGTSSSYGAAFPASGTAAGFSDGTNMSSARTFDADTGGGTQNVLGVNLRVGASGGSAEVAAGAGTTSASTLRVVLPTDQTVIPVSDNGSSLTVDGTVALSGTSAVNVSQVGGNAVNVGSGAAGTGTQRVILATDQPVIPVGDNGGSLTVDGTVTVSGTVDTELPAATTLTDATANPSTTSVGALGLLFNGTTWDRMRGDTTNGLLVNVSDSFLLDATFTGRFAAGAALSDNFANPTTTSTGAMQMVWDGATWDRAPGNSTDGQLVNLGANNDVTVTGTVTANAGTGNFSTNLAQYGGVAVSAANALHVQPGTGASFTVAQGTASNLRAQTASEGATGSAVPTSASLMGASDGTNLRAPKVFDLDASATTPDWVLGTQLRVGAWGASQPVSYAQSAGGNIDIAVYSDPKLSATPTTTAVTCATTATAAPSSMLSSRTTVTFVNNSAVTIYIGGSAVTTANGIPLLPGASFTDDVSAAPYYCRVASGTADLRVLEN